MNPSRAVLVLWYLYSPPRTPPVQAILALKGSSDPPPAPEVYYQGKKNATPEVLKMKPRRVVAVLELETDKSLKELRMHFQDLKCGWDISPIHRGVRIVQIQLNAIRPKKQR